MKHFAAVSLFFALVLSSSGIGQEPKEPNPSTEPVTELKPATGKPVTKLSEVVGRWTSVKAESTSSPGEETGVRMIMIIRDDGTAKFLAANSGAERLVVDGFLTFEDGRAAFKWTETDPAKPADLRIDGATLIANDPVTKTRITLRRVGVKKK